MSLGCALISCRDDTPQTSVRDCFIAVLIASGSEAISVGMSTQASAEALSLLYSSVGGGVLLSIPDPSAS